MYENMVPSSFKYIHLATLLEHPLNFNIQAASRTRVIIQNSS